MLSEFSLFVQKNKLFSKKHKLLLAISGGKDSVCLFHLLKDSGFNFDVAHCNFQLRGKESNKDEAFVKALAKKHQITFHGIRFETKKASKELKLGTQETARLLRYQWFDELIKEHQYHHLLTAHHKSDNTETILINLLRATGISGLHGIPLQIGQIVRPLLFTDRTGIDHYIKTHKIKYREDSSNASNDYLRNALRHQIVPRLGKLVHSVDEQFYKVSENISEYEQLADYFFKKTWEDYTKKQDNTVWISSFIFEQIPEKLLASFLFFNLKNYGFTKSQCENLSKAKEAKIGFELLADDYAILKERNGFCIIKSVEQEKKFIKISKKIKSAQLNNLSFEFQIVKNKGLKLRQEGCLFFDAGKITYPLKIRNWEAGDKIQILGMKGRKKVSDILTDRKIPYAKRPHQVVLENKNGEILAVFPNIVSELSKVDIDSVEVLCIQFKQIDL